MRVFDAAHNAISDDTEISVRPTIIAAGQGRHKQYTRELRSLNSFCVPFLSCNLETPGWATLSRPISVHSSSKLVHCESRRPLERLRPSLESYHFNQPLITTSKRRGNALTDQVLATSRKSLTFRQVSKKFLDIPIEAIQDPTSRDKRIDLHLAIQAIEQIPLMARDINRSDRFSRLRDRTSIIIRKPISPRVSHPKTSPAD